MYEQELHARVRVLEIAERIAARNHEPIANGTEGMSVGDNVKRLKPVRAQNVRQMAETLWSFAMPSALEFPPSSFGFTSEPPPPKIVPLPFTWKRISFGEAIRVDKPVARYSLMIGKREFARVDANVGGSCELFVLSSSNPPQSIVGPPSVAMRIAEDELAKWAISHPERAAEIAEEARDGA